MGKKGLSKNGHTAPQMSVTIREASTGKKHTSAKSSLKLQHIKNLAVWASRDAPVPSLAAFFGHHLASSSETLGAPVDPSLFTCERCESILHPGCNCTIRIEKTKTNARRKTKKTSHPRNNIVYTCHFCSHRNMKRGTPRNTSQPKIKPHSKSTNQNTTRKTIHSSLLTKDNIVSNAIAASPGLTTGEESHKGDNTLDIREMRISGITDTLEAKDGYDVSVPATPLTRSTLTLLESKMKKKNRSGAKKKVEPESGTNAGKSSNRRRRRSWSSLKEIAESSENDKRRKLMNLTVPFSMQ